MPAGLAGPTVASPAAEPDKEPVESPTQQAEDHLEVKNIEN